MAERLEAYENILNLMGEPPVARVIRRVTPKADGPSPQSTAAGQCGTGQGVDPGGHCAE